MNVLNVQLEHSIIKSPKNVRKYNVLIKLSFQFRKIDVYVKIQVLHFSMVKNVYHVYHQKNGILRQANVFENDKKYIHIDSNDIFIK